MSFAETIRDQLGDLREALSRADRFARMRLWIVGALGIDVLGTLLVVLLSGSRTLAVDVRFVEAFPSNQVMLQNQGSMLSDVKITIDGRYTAHLKELPPGSMHAVGLEMDREFRDDAKVAPPRDYKPRMVVVSSGVSRIDIDLQAPRK